MSKILFTVGGYLTTLDFLLILKINQLNQKSVFLPMTLIRLVVVVLDIEILKNYFLGGFRILIIFNIFF